MTELSSFLEESLQKAAAELDLVKALEPRGTVRRVGDGVAFVVGLEHIGYEELLSFDSGAFGLAYDLTPTGIGAILLSGAKGPSVNKLPKSVAYLGLIS